MKTHVVKTIKMKETMTYLNKRIKCFQFYEFCNETKEYWETEKQQVYRDLKPLAIDLSNKMRQTICICCRGPELP